MSRETIFTAILNLGLTEKHSTLESRRIKIVNLLNAVILFFLLIGISTYFLLEQAYPVVPELLFIFLAILSLVCSYAGRTELSFLLLTVNSNLSLFFVVEYYPFDSGSYLYYFPLIVSIVLLNNVTSRNWMAYVHFAISGLGFLLAIFLEVPQWKLQGLSEDTVHVLWYYNMIMSASAHCRSKRIAEPADFSPKQRNCFTKQLFEKNQRRTQCFTS